MALRSAFLAAPLVGQERRGRGGGRDRTHSPAASAPRGPASEPPTGTRALPPAGSPNGLVTSSTCPEFEIPPSAWPPACAHHERTIGDPQRWHRPPGDRAGRRRLRLLRAPPAHGRAVDRARRRARGRVNPRAGLRHRSDPATPGRPRPSGPRRGRVPGDARAPHRPPHPPLTGRDVYV